MRDFANWIRAHNMANGTDGLSGIKGSARPPGNGRSGEVLLFDMNQNVGFNNKVLIPALFIVIAFLNPLVSRFYPAFDKITIGLCLVLTVLLLLFINIYKSINSYLVCVVGFALCLYALNGFALSFLLEILIWMAFFGFLFVERTLLLRFAGPLLSLILMFSSMQIVFDFLFPVVSADNILDRFSGSFVMANNKSRYLVYILIFLLTAKLSMNNFLRWGMMLMITFSMMLGNSIFGILFMTVSILTGRFIRNIFIFLALIVLSGAMIFNYVNKHYNDSDALLINYNRYLDPDHGAYAVYKYGFEELKKMDYLGVGFGNFSSRAGQFLNYKVTRGIPETMILFNQDLFATKSPYGLSALYVLFIEFGIFSLPIIWVILKSLWQYKDDGFWGYFSFYYLFFIMNYNPTFFEFSEGGLYILTFILTNAYLKQSRLWIYSSRHTRTRLSGILW